MPYIVPTPADLKARFPDFTAVPDVTVQLWIDDAQRIVTTDWIEADYAPAIMALAAHEVTANGIGAGGVAAQIPAGVTSFRSASFSLAFSDAAASAAAAGGYGATRYGLAFQAMLRRNRGGPRTTGYPYPPCDVAL